MGVLIAKSFYRLGISPKKGLIKALKPLPGIQGVQLRTAYLKDDWLSGAAQRLDFIPASVRVKLLIQMDFDYLPRRLRS